MTASAEPAPEARSTNQFVHDGPFMFDRWVAHIGWPRRRAVFVIGVVLLIIPVVVAYLEAGPELLTLVTEGRGRQLFFYPLMITFLLAAIGPVQRTREDVAQALRPLAQVDDETYASVVDQACQVKPIGELFGAGVGIAFFLVIEGLYQGSADFPIAYPYIYFTGLLMFAVIGWSIFVSFAITRLTNALLRLPVEVDIFEPEELTSIGRQSLLLALIFVGAIILSLFFTISPTSLQDFLSLDNFVIYGLLVGLTLAVFFLNMHRTHALMAATRTQQLALTDRNLARAYYALQNAIAGGQDTHRISAEVNALAACKHELKTTRTWPYNTEMLRTLAISVLTPLVLGLVRVLAPLFLQ